MNQSRPWDRIYPVLILTTLVPPRIVAVCNCHAMHDSSSGLPNHQFRYSGHSTLFTLLGGGDFYTWKYIHFIGAPSAVTPTPFPASSTARWVRGNYFTWSWLARNAPLLGLLEL